MLRDILAGKLGQYITCNHKNHVENTRYLQHNNQQDTASPQENAYSHPERLLLPGDQSTTTQTDSHRSGSAIKPARQEIDFKTMGPQAKPVVVETILRMQQDISKKHKELFHLLQTKD